MFLEERIDRSGHSMWHAISSWLVVGLLILANIIGFVLDKAATIAP
jgi:hypothetical protein